MTRPSCCTGSRRRRSTLPGSGIVAACEGSLKRLQTDYVDIYVMHRDNEEVPVGEFMDVLNEHYAAGRIRAFGGSNWSHTRIAEANAYAARHGLQPMTVSSPNYGLAEQVLDPWGPGCVTLSGPQNTAARAWYQANRMPVLASISRSEWCTLWSRHSTGTK